MSGESVPNAGWKDTPEVDGEAVAVICPTVHLPVRAGFLPLSLRLAGMKRYFLSGLTCFLVGENKRDNLCTGINLDVEERNIRLKLLFYLPL